ncbi:N-methyl-L-tryptophan oxidase [Haliscomenobacter hydrossis]|nr:N-methyl-L-tryptophan oxidase [Haliscomenobacter hydrossis]
MDSTDDFFDVIVLGVGSMGASACFHLANRGLKVLGIEQFDIPHDQGSHAGQSRIIRKAYFEHPDYVPLLERAYQNWHDLEALTGTQIYHETGLLYCGPPENDMMQGVKLSAKTYAVPLNMLSQEQHQAQFPQIAIPAHYEGLLEPAAGFIPPERAILLYTNQAIRQGAVIQTQEKVLSWHKHPGGDITVISEKGRYRAAKLVITAGPWAGHFMPQLAPKLQVTRQVLAWVIPKNPQRFELGQLPCWMIVDEVNPGILYGFPIMPVGQFNGPIGFKAGYHVPGQTTDPNQVNRGVSSAEAQMIIEALQRFFPEGYRSTHVLKTCLYTYTPDENFIIDFLPEFDQKVAIAAGFSGHGFKFASVVGEILADLTIDGKTALPIGFLNADRYVRP